MNAVIIVLAETWQAMSSRVELFVSFSRRIQLHVSLLVYKKAAIEVLCNTVRKIGKGFFF
jgi:hypothetical protein